MKKSGSGGELWATLCSLWPVQDLNPWPPTPEPSTLPHRLSGRWKNYLTDIIRAVHENVLRSHGGVNNGHFADKEDFLHHGNPHPLVIKHENSVAFIALKFWFRCFLTYFWLIYINPSLRLVYELCYLGLNQGCKNAIFESVPLPPLDDVIFAWNFLIWKFFGKIFPHKSR